jgi:subtilisin family serine protease
VTDGVDVINYSIGGPSSNPWTDDDAQAFLDAWEANIFVATSAGNSGPGEATMGSPADAPWVLSVGAATHNRAFLNSLVDMTTDAGTTLLDIEGRSITDGYGPAPIVYAGDYGNALCKEGIWPSNEFNGEIVVCDRGEIARVAKSANVKAAGGGGMILANQQAEGDGLSADSHSIPSVHITYKDGVKLKNWLANGDTGHTATIAGTTMAVNDDRFGDHMASFSSRGPDPAAPGIVKPDIIGPGVDIIAAVADDGDAGNGPDYDAYSGTSMSSPHLAGAGILMKQAHPT